MPGFFLMLGIADAQHADIVRLVGAAREFGYAGNGLMHEVLGGLGRGIVEVINQAFHSHFFAFSIGGFRQAVRVHQDA